MEDTARQIICNAKQDEREAIPKLTNQSYIELYSELEQYRSPRVFDQLIGERISYVNNDKSIVECSTEPFAANTAICNHVMRAGKHYITFTIMEVDEDNNGSIHIGIVRPIPNWDKKGLDYFDPFSCFQKYSELRSERNERWGFSKVHLCSLISYGVYVWSDWVRRYEVHDWDGAEFASFGKGDEVGMLLDLEAGTLCVYKNGRRLGILKGHTMIDGLSGEYCWAVSLWEAGESVSIKKGIVPTN